MYIDSNQNWMRYSTTGSWKLSDIKDGGKWMFYYKNRDFATQIINQAFTQDVCKYAKHTKGSSGICCFYVSGTSEVEHRKVIKFMLDHNLIRLTDDLNYFDPAFKFNGQSWSKQYGPNFEGLIKLSDFVDITTGNNKVIDLKANLTIDSLQKSKAISTDRYLQPLVTSLDTFVRDYINNLFSYNPETTDINDKIIFLAPSGYNLRKLYQQKDSNSFLTLAAQIISYNLKLESNTQQVKLDKLKTKASPAVRNLMAIAENAELKLDHQQSIITIDNHINNRFIANYLHLDVDDDNANVLGYLLFLSILNISKQNIDYIIDNI